MSIRAPCHPERSEGPLSSAAQGSLASLGMTIRVGAAGCAYSYTGPLYSRYFSAYGAVTMSGGCMHVNTRAGAACFPDVYLISAVSENEAGPRRRMGFQGPAGLCSGPNKLSLSET